MKKLFRYLFQRPDIKVGEKTSYYDRTCMRVYFDWKDGLWLIECEDVIISWGLEQFYRNKAKRENNDLPIQSERQKRNDDYNMDYYP